MRDFSSLTADSVFRWRANNSLVDFLLFARDNNGVFTHSNEVFWPLRILLRTLTKPSFIFGAEISEPRIDIMILKINNM